MKRSGDVDGVRNPFSRRMPRPLGVRVALSSVAEVGLNDTGLRGNAGGSTSSMARLSVNGVLGIEYSKAGGDGYKPPSPLEPESELGKWLPLRSQACKVIEFSFDPLRSELELDLKVFSLLSLEKREDVARRERRPLHLRGLAVAYLVCPEFRSSMADAGW